MKLAAGHFHQSLNAWPLGPKVELDVLLHFKISLTVLWTWNLRMSTFIVQAYRGQVEATFPQKTLRPRPRLTPCRDYVIKLRFCFWLDPEYSSRVGVDLGLMPSWELRNHVSCGILILQHSNLIVA